jgi:hypothetical protein
MRGRIVGLRAMLGAAEVVPAGIASYQAIRGFNDQPEPRIMGSAGGRLVTSRPDLDEEPFTEEDAFARARQQGQENRAAYRQQMGTPRRPPRQPWGGEPEAQSPQPKKPDTSDLRRRTA